LTNNEKILCEKKFQSGKLDISTLTRGERGERRRFKCKS
jgi:hypothetical protein